MTKNEERTQLIKTCVGLSDGQRRHEGVRVGGTRGSGWYNQRGEWVGWGDLDAEEMRGIAHVLAPNELFIVLHEGDSYYRFLRDLVPDTSRGARSEDAPGLDYIAARAFFIIGKGAIWRVHNVQPSRPVETMYGVDYHFIDQKHAEEKILHSQD